MIWKTRWLQVTTKEDRNTYLLTCLLFVRTYRLTTINLLILDSIFMRDITSALFVKFLQKRALDMIRSTTNKLVTTINKLYKRVLLNTTRIPSIIQLFYQYTGSRSSLDEYASSSLLDKYCPLSECSLCWCYCIENFLKSLLLNTEFHFVFVFGYKFQNT